MSEQIIIEGDCLKIMRGFADKSFDLVLTDPPYGIGVGRMNLGFSAASRLEKTDWDNQTPSPEYFDEIFRVSKKQIIWGGNYFDLRPSRGFFVWDKGGSFKDRDFAECELAWCSEDMNARIFARNPLSNGDYKNKQHISVKPLELMNWCLSLFPDAQSILDPFMGSGTTLVAAKYLNRNATGIEISPKYCEIARTRLLQEMLF